MRCSQLLFQKDFFSTSPNSAHFVVLERIPSNFKLSKLGPQCPVCRPEEHPNQRRFRPPLSVVDQDPGLSGFKLVQGSFPSPRLDGFVFKNLGKQICFHMLSMESKIKPFCLLFFCLKTFRKRYFEIIPPGRLLSKGITKLHTQGFNHLHVKSCLENGLFQLDEQQ